MNTVKILLASRAIESPPYEGGFVLLHDIAHELSQDPRFAISMFAATKSAQTGIHTERVFRKPGWTAFRRYEFMRGMSKATPGYDLVHTAHIPTVKNVPLITKATKKSRASGTRYVQTVTGLPKVSLPAEEMKTLLWGDHIVCQTQEVYEKVAKLRASVSLITPWPSPSRVAPDPIRRATTRTSQFKGFDHVVLFPGEFDRLGVDDSFSQCLATLFKESPNTCVVLACRFDKAGRGKAFSKLFPGKVISLGETSKIIPLIEAADLVIYPVKKMDSKFNPPLVLTEAMQLGTPVLTSSLIGLDPSVSPLFHSSELAEGWNAFGSDIARILAQTKPGGLTQRSAFKSMVASYAAVYANLVAN